MSYGGGGGYGQQPQTRSKVVFVGNLPFDYTEEQFVEVFNSVGPVVSFRLVFDHNTGKPKGFGFCEYRDADTAASALRNLQGVEVGGRGLRLDFADTDDSPPSKRGGFGGGRNFGGGGGGYGAPGGQGFAPPQQQHGYAGGGGGGGMSGPPLGAPTGPGGGFAANGPPPVQAIPPPMLPGGTQPRPLPPGIPLEPGKSSTDKITETIGTMAPGQLLDVMSQMKALVIASPYEARALLTSNPQLSYALFQAMLCMGIVDPALLSKAFPSAFPAGAGRPPPNPAAPYSSAPPPAAYGAASAYGAPPTSYGTPPPPPQGPAAGPYNYQRSGPPPSNIPPPPVAGGNGYGGYGPSAGAPPVAAKPPAASNYPAHPASAAPPGPSATPQATPDQAALIQQVLSMTEAQIASLDENSRNTILQIRQQAQRAMGR
ncbi:hypothetical protein JCM11491_003595 [Sporobolomyces phaffii]